jgi:hypothetical protein
MINDYTAVGLARIAITQGYQAEAAFLCHNIANHSIQHAKPRGIDENAIEYLEYIKMQMINIKKIFEENKEQILEYLKKEDAKWED